MKKKYTLVCILAFLICSAKLSAQEITNIRAETKGNLVIIQYDLTSKIAGQLFEVSVFSSHNSMQEPLVYVRGDVGVNVVPGRNKRIEWGAKKEIGVFDGQLSLKLEAKLVFSPMIVRTPKEDTYIRRGRNYEITWDGGVEQENLQLELWKDSTLSFIINRVPNAGKYTWELPMTLAPASTYKIRLMSVAAPSNFDFSEPFEIRRKIPMAAKLAPVGIAVGVGTWLLINALTVPEEPPLPSAPDPEKPK